MAFMFDASSPTFGLLDVNACPTLAPFLMMVGIVVMETLEVR